MFVVQNKLRRASFDVLLLSGLYMYTQLPKCYWSSQWISKYYATRNKNKMMKGLKQQRTNPMSSFPRKHYLQQKIFTRNMPNDLSLLCDSSTSFNFFILYYQFICQYLNVFYLVIQLYHVTNPIVQFKKVFIMAKLSLYCVYQTTD